MPRAGLAPLELRARDRALFASDLHLHDADPDTAGAFFDALAREAPGASHVFLLGDLFEAWVGDDDASAVGARLAGALDALARDGTRVYLMRGNRDFLLDAAVGAAGAGAAASAGGAAQAFSARCGATMLADPCAIVAFGTRVLLSHGDALCTFSCDHSGRIIARLCQPRLAHSSRT